MSIALMMYRYGTTNTVPERSKGEMPHNHTNEFNEGKACYDLKIRYDAVREIQLRRSQASLRGTVPMALWYTSSFGTRWPSKQYRDKSEATLDYAACNGPQIAMAWQLWEKEQQTSAVVVAIRGGGVAVAGKDLSPSSASGLASFADSWSSHIEQHHFPRSI
jgi:hypothetical protein